MFQKQLMYLHSDITISTRHSTVIQCLWFTVKTKLCSAVPLKRKIIIKKTGSNQENKIYVKKNRVFATLLRIEQNFVESTVLLATLSLVHNDYKAIRKVLLNFGFKNVCRYANITRPVTYCSMLVSIYLLKSRWCWTYKNTIPGK